MTASVPDDALVQSLDAYVSGIEDRLLTWAHSISVDLDGVSSVTGGAIDRIIKPEVETILADAGLDAAGAGFIGNFGLLGENRSFISWWQGTGIDRVDALANLSTSSQGRYLRADWFRDPLNTGRLTVTGPFIDMLCTDEFILTFTTPVRWRGHPEVAGLAGIDVTVSTFERRSLPVLRRLGEEAALVNTEDRVIAAVPVRLAAGDFAPQVTRSWPIGSQLRAVLL